MTPNQLKKTRNTLGLSQWAVSKMTGVSRYKITMYETGYDQLTDEELEHIEVALDKAKFDLSKKLQ